jgi:hypothetical protein
MNQCHSMVETQHDLLLLKLMFRMRMVNSWDRKGLGPCCSDQQHRVGGRVQSASCSGVQVARASRGPAGSARVSGCWVQVARVSGGWVQAAQTSGGWVQADQRWWVHADRVSSGWVQAARPRVPPPRSGAGPADPSETSHELAARHVHTGTRRTPGERMRCTSTGGLAGALPPIIRTHRA